MAPPSKNSKKKNEEQQLPLVPETILKKRHDLDELARKRAALEDVEPGRRNKKKGQKKKKTKGMYVIKPETILSRARNRRNHHVRYKRVMKKGMQKRAVNHKVIIKTIDDEQQQHKEDDDDDTNKKTRTKTTTTYQANSWGASMVFVVRIRNDIAIPRNVKYTLRHKLHLSHVNDGVFIKYDETHRKLLHLVEPWIVYGPPQPQSVQDLLERRGHLKVDGSDDGDNNSNNHSRVPLSDNTIIERIFGEKHGLLCIQDVVHELVHVGPAFDDVVQTLYPFRLSDTKTTFERQTLKLKDNSKSEYGDRGDLIQEYIQHVL